MASKHLTPKQEKFVQEYLVSGNATEAYKKAYPVTKNWKSTSIGQQGDKSLKILKYHQKFASYDMPWQNGQRLIKTG